MHIKFNDHPDKLFGLLMDFDVFQVYSINMIMKFQCDIGLIQWSAYGKVIDNTK